MTALLSRLRDRVVDAPDTVCLDRARLVTEAWAMHEHEPAPIRRACVFAHVLRHMPLDLQSNPYFAGNTSSKPHAWMLLPEFGFSTDGQVIIENGRLKGILGSSAVPNDLRAFWAGRATGGNGNCGHLAVDLDRVVNEGLASVIWQLDAHADEGDAEARQYRQAMRLCCAAVIDWANRYAQTAEAAAASQTDDDLAALHRRVAAACRRVPAQPARNLFEGLQAIAITQHAIAIEGHALSVSIGLPDRVLARFADELPHDDAVELIGAFMLKIHANAIFGSGSKTQAITIGGADAEGCDRCNALTAAFLDACNLMRLGDPHLFLRWHAGMDAGIKRQAAEMLAAGLSMPLLISDAPTAAGFERAGVTRGDAWDYCVIGCNELGIPARLSTTALAVGGVNYLEQLNHLLLDDTVCPSITGMDELLGRLADRMRGHISRTCMEGETRLLRDATERPTPFTSALMRASAAQGRDMHICQSYRLRGFFERGLSNAANALAAIERVVFDRRTMTLSELVRSMRDDFADRSIAAWIAAAPKWGNDDEAADRWARRLIDMRTAALRHVEREHSLPLHLPCHVVRSLHYVDGRRIAASADGRKAHTPVCDSIGAVAGTAWIGPTATLNSVLNIDAARDYPGGYNLNITLPLGAVGADHVGALIEAFFSDGGQELQVNSLDAAMLREAQRQPERYRDLVVRISGFSALFVKLSRCQQHELIARAEEAQ